MSAWPPITIYEPPTIPKGRAPVSTETLDAPKPAPKVYRLPPLEDRACKNEACGQRFTPHHYLQIYCTVECRTIVRREAHRIQEKRNRYKRLMRAKG